MSLGSPLGVISSEPARRRVGKRPAHGVVHPIGAHGPASGANRHDIHADAVGHSELPVIHRHSGDYMVGREGPGGRHIAVFHPHAVVGRRKAVAHQRILHEERRVGLDLALKYLALVHHAILQREGRGDELAARAEVVEFAVVQRHHGHRKRVDLRVIDRRIGAESAAEITVEVVESYIAILVIRPLHQHLHGSLRQQPYAYIHQE